MLYYLYATHTVVSINITNKRKDRMMKSVEYINIDTELSLRDN